MSLAARCIAAIATGVVAADLPGKARAHVERKTSAKRRPSTDRHPAVKAAAERKRAGKDERRAKVAAIREASFARWNGLCAIFCRSPASDLHHVLSGPERRARESLETVLPVCRDHHKALHRGDLHILEDAMNVCTDNGMREARTALARRITKLLEARAAQGRP